MSQSPIRLVPRSAPGTLSDSREQWARFVMNQDLLTDDLEVALLYQRANGALKIAVRRMLEAYVRREAARPLLLAPGGLLRLPAEAPFHERRCGVDRRAAPSLNDPVDSQGRGR